MIKNVEVIFIILTTFIFYAMPGFGDDKKSTIPSDHPCVQSLSAVKEFLGEPDDVNYSHSQGYHKITWIYYSDEQKVEFEWGPTIQSCQKIFLPFTDDTKKAIEFKMRKLKKEHPEWPQEICKLIAERKVRIGMTVDQVRASWGEPKHIYTSITAAGKAEAWDYSRDKIYIQNGKVTEMLSVD